MKYKTLSIKKHIVRFGVVQAIMRIIYTLLTYLTDSRITSNWMLSVFDLSIFIGLIFYAIYAYKTANNGFLNLGQALKIGFCIALISTTTFIILDVIFLKIIAPENIYTLIDLNERSTIGEPIKHDGLMSKENSFLFKISSVSLIANLVFGGIISFLAGAIMSKRKKL